MIKTPTTFVVGAGASKDYGFPLGSALLEEAQKLEPRNPEYQLLLRTVGLAVEPVGRVMDDLRGFERRSIDDFMEKRRDDPNALKVARHLVAILLGARIARMNAERERERKQGTKRTVGRDADWIRHVVDEMADRADTFDQFLANDVSFVTFNFDSVIEDVMSRHVQSTYPRTFDRAVFTSRFPVHHVHGRLPPVPDRELTDHHFNGFGADWHAWVAAAAESVRVTADEVEDDVLATARTACARAEVLCFLGFSYHPTNLQRLGLGRPNYVRMVYGTACGMSPSDHRRAVGRLDVAMPPTFSAQLGDAKQNAVDILKSLSIFRD